MSERCSRPLSAETHEPSAPRAVRRPGRSQRRRRPVRRAWPLAATLLAAAAMAFIAPLAPVTAHAAPAGVTVQGTVLDKSTGTAVAASVVVIRGGTGEDAQVIGFGTSDAGTGAFSIGDIPDGTGYRVRATLQGYAATVSDPFDVAGGQAPLAVDLELAPYETITILHQGDGTVSPDDSVSVPWGESLTLTVTPGAHNHVAALMDNNQNALGQLSGSQFQIASVMGDHQIAITFEIDTFTVTPTVVGTGGDVWPAGPMRVPWGGSQTFMVQADDGTLPLDFNIDGKNSPALLHPEGGGLYSYRFQNVTADHTLSVAFHRTLQLDSSDVAAGSTVRISAQTTTTFKVSGLTSCPLSADPADPSGCAGLTPDSVAVVIGSDFPPTASLVADGGRTTVGDIWSGAVDLRVDDTTVTGGTGSPIALKNGANVQLTLAGANRLTGGDGAPAVSVPDGNKLTIKSATGGGGMLKATGGAGAAGIGGSRATPNGGQIFLTSGLVWAEGGAGAAGIGGGAAGAAGDITVRSGAFVVAEGGGSTDSGHVDDVGSGENTATGIVPGRPGDSVTVTGGSMYGVSNSYLRPFSPSGQALDPLFVPAGVPSGAEISGGSPALVGPANAITDAQAAFLGDAFPAAKVAAVMWESAGTYEAIQVAGAGSYSATVGGGYPTPGDSGSDNWLLTNPVEIDASATNGPDVDQGFGTVGKISPAGAVTARDGADVRFTFTPHEDFTVSSVIVDGTAVSPVPRDGYTFSAVHGHHTIQVVFGQRPTLVLTDQNVPGGVATIAYTGPTTADVEGISCPEAFGDCTGLDLADVSFQLDHLSTTRVVIDGGLGADPAETRAGTVSVTLFGMDVQPADGAPLQVTGGARATLYMIGQNRLRNAAASTAGSAGLEVDEGSAVAIAGAMTGTTLQAVGARGGAGIGGGSGEPAGSITFRLADDFGTVLAVYAAGGRGAAGIGGGYGGGAGNVTIGQGTMVAATGGGDYNEVMQAAGVAVPARAEGDPAEDIGAGQDYDDAVDPGVSGNRLTVTGGTVLGTHLTASTILQPVDTFDVPLYPLWVPAALAGGTKLSGGGLPDGMVATTMTDDQAAFFQGTGFPASLISACLWVPAGDYHGIATGSSVAAATYDAHVTDQMVTVNEATSNNWLLVDPSVVTLTACPGGTVTPAAEPTLTGGKDAQTTVTVRSGADQSFLILPSVGAWVAEVDLDGQAVALTNAQAAGFTYTLSAVTSAHTVRVVFGFQITVDGASLGSSHDLRIAPDSVDTFHVSGLDHCPAVAGDCTGLPINYADIVLDGSGSAPVPADLTVVADGTLPGGVRTGAGHLTLKQANLTTASESPLSFINGANVLLSLVGDNVITACASGCAAISVGRDASLKIQGYDTLPSAPASATRQSWGTLTATGAAAAAGIGGEAAAQAGSIQIVSGYVRATGGTTGAGIGGGGGASASTITISGGTVVARGGQGAAGIGGGYGGAAGDVVIRGSATQVVARGGLTSGADKPYDIGAGAAYAGFLVPGAAGDSVVIEGGAVFAPSAVMAPATAENVPEYPVYVPAGAPAGQLVNVPGMAREHLAQVPSAQDVAWFGDAFPAGVLAAEAWAPKGGYSGIMIAADGPYTVNVPATRPAYTVAATDHWLTDASSFAIEARTTSGADGDAHGTVSPAGRVDVRAGADQMFYFTPDAGYRIASVTVDDQSVPVVGSYDFQNVVADHTIDVAFAAVDPAATWRIGAANLAEGDTVTLTYTGDGTMTLSGVASCPAAGCTGLDAASTRLILGSDLPADTKLALDGQMPNAANDDVRATPVTIGLADGLKLSSTTGSPIRLAAGASLRLLVDGSVSLTTVDGVSAVAGILAPAGTELSVGAARQGAQLIAIGAADGAGIGGGAGQAAGTIRFGGVSIAASGGDGAAGIGGGEGGAGGTVQITDGLVRARGGIGGAGIGGGQWGAGGTVQILGGRVIGVGGMRAAGIGGGEGQGGGTINVSGGAVAATGGASGGAGIGGGYGGGTGRIRLTGGAVWAQAGGAASDVGPGLSCTDPTVSPAGDPPAGTSDKACAGTVRLGLASLVAVRGRVSDPVLDDSAISAAADPPAAGTAVFPLFVPASVGSGKDVRPGGGLGAWVTPSAGDMSFLGEPYNQSIAAELWVPAGSYPQAAAGGVSGYRATVDAVVPLATADTSDNWLLDSGTTVQVTAQGGGAATPSGTVRVRPGASLTLALAPDAGHWVAGVTLDGQAQAPATWLGNTFTMNSVQAGAHQVQVTFGSADTTIPVSDDDVPDGTLTLSFDSDTAFSVTGAGAPRTGLSVASDIVRLNGLTGTAVVIDGGEPAGVTRLAPIHVELASLQLSAAAPIRLRGGANVVFELDGTSSVTAASQGRAAIAVPQGSRAVFQQLAGAAPGILLAIGGSESAGIGSAAGAAGQITLASGAVRATGGAGAAALGGARQGAGGNVLVLGGAFVVAVPGSGATYAVGAGAGYFGASGVAGNQVQVAGGTLYSTGQVMAAADLQGRAVWPLYVPAAAGQGLAIGNGIGGTLPAGFSARTITAEQAAVFGSAFPGALAAQPWLPVGDYDRVAVGATGSWWANVQAQPGSYLTARATNWLVDASATHIVTASVAGGSGQVTPAGPVRVPDGGTAQFVFAPGAGAVIQSVLVDGVDVARAGDPGYNAAAKTYTFQGVTADHTLAVVFGRTQSVSIADSDISGSGGNGVLRITFTDNATFDIHGLASCPLAGGCSGLSIQSTQLIVSALQDGHRILVDGAAGGATVSDDGVFQDSDTGLQAVPDSVTRPVPIDITLAAANAHSTEASPLQLTAGAYVRLELAGTSVLSTEGGMNLPGIAVPQGSRLEVTDSDTGAVSAAHGDTSGPATLEATGAVDAAGIGACGGCDAGTIDIEGGVVTATGGDGGAGLGGAYGGDAGDVTIGGGRVTAQGGTGAAGIGGGHTHDGERIRVTGGWVRAQGGTGAAGIGGGVQGSGGVIDLTGGTVYAKGGGEAGGIGGGYAGAAGTIDVAGTVQIAADSGPVAGRHTPMIGPSGAYAGPLVPGQVGNCTTYEGGSVFSYDMSDSYPTDACGATAEEAAALAQLYPVYLPAQLQGGLAVQGSALDSGRSALTATDEQVAFFGDYFPGDQLAGVVFAPAGDQDFTVGGDSYPARVRAQLPSYSDAQSDNWVLAGAIPIHLAVEGPGSIVASGETVRDEGDFLVRPGASQSFAFRPLMDGAQVTGLKVDGQTVAPRASYAVSNVVQERSIEVRFTMPMATRPVPEQVHQVPPPDHTIQVTAGLGGMVAPAGAQPVSDGGSLSVAIKAAPYYRVDRVIVNGQNIGAVGSYNFDHVTFDQTLTAYFVRDVKKVKASQTTVRLVKGHKLKVVARAYMAGPGAGGMSGTAKVRWSSSRPSVAGVTASGTIKGKKAGRATLKARAGGRSVTVRVTVVARRGAGVASVRARVPKSLRVHQVAWVTGTPKPGTAVGARVTYRSSAPAVASIDSAGRLTAKKAGRAVITVRAGGKSKRVRVTVK